MMLFPMALALMYGRMLRRLRHAWVLYAVMGALLLGMIGWAVYWDALQPNPDITVHAGNDSFTVEQSARGGLVGPKVVNVLEVNLALRARDGAPAA